MLSFMKVCAGQKYMISFYALKLVHFCARISHHSCILVHKSAQKCTLVHFCALTPTLTLVAFVHLCTLLCTLVHFRAGKYTYLLLTKSAESALSRTKTIIVDSN